MISKILRRERKECLATVEFDRSRFETIAEVTEKAQRMKQNQGGFCFKIRPLSCFQRLFQKLDLKSAEVPNGL